MDGPGLDPVLHRAALEKLAWFNGLAGGTRTIATELLRIKPAKLGPLRVLDLATGAGDLPMRLMERAERDGVPWIVDGADISSLAVEYARERVARSNLRTQPQFMVMDALRDPLPQGYDVITCSLFLHHLSAPDAIGLLAKMHAAAARAVIVQDLLRSQAGMRLTWLVTRLFSRNPLILEDGPLSVAAAFTLEEAEDLAKRAGLPSAKISRRWPCRWVCTAVH